MKISKRTVFIAACALLLITVAMLSVGLSGGTKMIKAEDEAARLEYIRELGYTAKDEPPVIKNIVIPSVFTDVYENYNLLQIESGFDLSPYKGEYAVTYTYKISDYPDDSGGFSDNVQLTLILWNNHIVGGDIASTELDGFMTGLSGGG